VFCSVFSVFVLVCFVLCQQYTENLKIALRNAFYIFVLRKGANNALMAFLSPRFFKGKPNFLHNVMKQILDLADDEHTLALMKAGKQLDRVANQQSGKKTRDLSIPRYLFIDVTCEKGDSVALTGIFKDEFPVMFY
jgi:hypothetical protein